MLVQNVHILRRPVAGPGPAGASGGLRGHAESTTVGNAGWRHCRGGTSCGRRPQIRACGFTELSRLSRIRRAALRVQ